MRRRSVLSVPARPDRPRIIATDLDGTVVRSDDNVSDRTHAAFAAARDEGIVVVGVTGRGPRLIELCRRDLPSADFLVLAQGAYVVDLRTGEPRVLHSAWMSGGLVTSVLAQIEAETGPLSVLAEPCDAPDVALWGEKHPAWRYDAVRECSRDEAFAAPVVKAFMHSDAYDADELLAIARTLVGPDVLEMTQAGLGYVELCPAGTTKATGLAKVAEHLGVDADDVLVFGDMPNDLPMFGWAGWGRVAVANAHRELLAVADEVTLSNDEDGVAVYVERVLEATERPAA